MITIAQAAAIAAAHPQHKPGEQAIRRAAAAGIIRAEKFGRQWALDEQSLRAWLDDPRAHRPGRKPGGEGR